MPGPITVEWGSHVEDGPNSPGGPGVPESHRHEPTRNVTLESVARLAGVSRATASRVVKGSVAVSPETRQAVERAIEELDYLSLIHISEPTRPY